MLTRRFFDYSKILVNLGIRFESHHTVFSNLGRLFWKIFHVVFVNFLYALSLFGPFCHRGCGRRRIFFFDFCLPLFLVVHSYPFYIISRFESLEITKTTFLIEDFESCRWLDRASISLLLLVQNDDSKSSKGKVVWETSSVPRAL